ncbi:MAG: tyrosine-protein phosphatase [Solirubrobacterales bacterium]|nr:tyrosine-protein phosphatase [Solirubrobacterales bacterium]
MDADRLLDWNGCWNARDLGGLPLAGGGLTRRRSLVRSDALDGLSRAGWRALSDYGVRTVIDLRNDDERTSDHARGPDSVTTLRLPLDAVEDREFWDHWEREPPPLFYGAHLERFPERSAAVVRAIARAEPGGVLFHCVGGRDRTGMISVLALALAGVTADAIAADHALSDERLSPMYAARGVPDQGEEIATELAARGIGGAGTAIRAMLEGFDLEAVLRRGGLGEEDVGLLRARLRPS